MHILVLQPLAEQLGWPPTESLKRLEGFTQPWEFAVHKGRAIQLNASLAENGIGTDAVITWVRRVLVPEAWKVKCPSLILLTCLTKCMVY